MHRHCRRLHQRALLEADVRGQLVAKVGRQQVVFRERAVVGRRARELHQGAEVVVPALALRTAPAGHAGLEGDAVAGLEGGDGGADAVDGACGFVAEDHGTGQDELADSTRGVVVDLGGC